MHSICAGHSSVHTQETCVDRIKRFILVNSKRRPDQMGEPEGSPTT